MELRRCEQTLNNPYSVEHMQYTITNILEREDGGGRMVKNIILVAKDQTIACMVFLCPIIYLTAW